MGQSMGDIGHVHDRAVNDPTFRHELESKPREVLERELDRPITDVELQQAADELKKRGIHVQLTGPADGEGKRH